ncbi:MAG: hypothetical protein ACOYNO_05800 [Saprospiraceae bacterium]
MRILLTTTLIVCLALHLQAQQKRTELQQKIYAECQTTWVYDCDCVTDKYPAIAADLKAERHKKLLAEAEKAVQEGAQMVDPYGASTGNFRQDAYSNRIDAREVQNKLKTNGANALPEPQMMLYWQTVEKDPACRGRQNIYNYALKNCPYTERMGTSKEDFCECYANKYADEFTKVENKVSSKSMTDIGSRAAQQCANK